MHEVVDKWRRHAAPSAAPPRGGALHEIAVDCTTNELCRRAVEALRQAGVPAYFRNTDDYRLTPCAALVEGCVAWACRGREISNYRLGSLLRQWRSIQGTGHTREQRAALTSWRVPVTESTRI